MKQDIERIFVIKIEIFTEVREKALTDKYLRGEITIDWMVRLLEVMRPKQLKHEGDLPGYQ